MSSRWAATLLVLASACSSSAEFKTAGVRVRAGPAAERPIKRVVALQATCGTLETVRIEKSDPSNPSFEVRPCPPRALEGVDQIVRAALDFQGLEIIDTDKVNAVTATRHEVEERKQFYPTETAETPELTLTSQTTETEGASFDDATPFEQADILKQLRAEGVLTTRIWIGAGVGFSRRRTITVQVRLLAASDSALVWARRCELEVGGLAATDEIAMERGAKCAVEGARPR